MQIKFYYKNVLLLLIINLKFTSMIFSQDNYFEYSKDVSIHSKKTGNGKRNIILLHGFGASINTWDDLNLNVDTNQITIHAIDLKGFGLSSKFKDNKYSLNDQANIIIQYIKKNQLTDISLIGHSYGGGVALLVILDLLKENNNSIKNLVLIDCAAYSDNIPFFIKYLRTPILNSLLFLTGKKYRAKFTLKRLFYDKSKITKKIIDRYVASFSQSGIRYSFVRAAKQIVPDDYLNTISKYTTIKIPTLIIWGKEDMAISVKIGERLNQQIQNSKIEIIDNCGHIPQEEKPEFTSELITKFINQ